MKRIRYRRSYCRALLDTFDQPAVQERTETLYHTNGEVKQERPVQTPTPLPTFEAFAADIGVPPETLAEWQRLHPEFAEACALARCHQRRILIANGLLGGYNAAFARFLAEAVLGIGCDGASADLPSIVDDI